MNIDLSLMFTGWHYRRDVPRDILFWFSKFQHWGKTTTWRDTRTNQKNLPDIPKITMFWVAILLTYWELWHWYSVDLGPVLDIPLAWKESRW